jgi:hypothetical protein
MFLLGVSGGFLVSGFPLPCHLGYQWLAGQGGSAGTGGSLLVHLLYIIMHGFLECCLSFCLQVLILLAGKKQFCVLLLTGQTLHALAWHEKHKVLP